MVESHSSLDARDQEVEHVGKSRLDLPPPTSPLSGDVPLGSDPTEGGQPGAEEQEDDEHNKISANWLLSREPLVCLTPPQFKQMSGARDSGDGELLVVGG